MTDTRLTVRLGRPIQTVRPSGQDSAVVLAQTQRKLQEARQQAGREIQAMRLDMDSDRRRLESTRSALQDALEQTETLQARIVAQSEEQVVELALEIARKVLQQEIQAGRYQIDPIVQEALARVPARQGVCVHLNPDDYAACGLRKDSPDEGGFSRVRFQPDPTVEPGRCLLETAEGFIDGGVDRQLAVVAKAMKGGVMTAVLNLEKYRRRLGQADTMPCQGSVVRVAGLTVESKGPPVGMGQLCQIVLSSGRSVPAEVVGFQNESRILLPLEGIEGICPGDAVLSCLTPRSIQLDRSILGRVIDGLGRPIDGKGPLTGRDICQLDNTSPPPLERQRIEQPLSFGIRVFDGILTCGRGQRIGIFAGAGVGKSTLLGEIARASAADVNVLALVGERGREVRHFLEDSLGERGMAKSVVAVATSDASPIQRTKVAFLAIAIAEYFRDQGANVLFMMDSLTRFAQAQREIGLAAGEPPTTKGYCPSVFSLLPKLTERLGCAARGSITGILTILVEGDDMNDPVADSVRSLLDGHIVLSRQLAEVGHYPAVDIQASVSRLINAVTSPEHRQAAGRLRAIYSTFHAAEDLINIGAYAPGSNKRIDKAIALIERVNEFLIQPTGTVSDFQTTVRRLLEITKQWDFSASDEAPSIPPPGGKPK